MDTRSVGVALIGCSALVLSLSQILLKSRLTVHGAAPGTVERAGPYIAGLLVDPWAWVGGSGLILAALCWYAGLSRLPLTEAFPIAAISYPLVFGGSLLFLAEPLDWRVLLGNVMVLAGVYLIITRGA